MFGPESTAIYIYADIFIKYVIYCKTFKQDITAFKPKSAVFFLSHKCVRKVEITAFLIDVWNWRFSHFPFTVLL